MDLGQQGHVSPSSVVELERQLADAFKTTFAARQAAYDDEVSHPSCFKPEQILHALCFNLLTALL